MFDYYNHVQTLTEEQLYDEIDNLNKKLIKLNSASPMFAQLLDMRDMATSALHEASVKRRVKIEDTVLEIGTVESTEQTPDYSTDDLLTAIVYGYVKKKDKK